VVRQDPVQADLSVRRHSLLHTAGNVVWAARNERAQLAPLLATYARLKAQELMKSRRPPHGVRRTRILSMDVAFLDHYWLVEMFEEIFLRGQYAFESPKERPLIVDVGSNIGLSILFFKRLFPAAAIVGFEPDPAAFRLLRRNVDENRLRDVRLLNAAVYDGASSVQLYEDPATPGSPQHSTRPGRVGGTSREVPATRLSEHLTEPVDYLKLDVEGAERVVVEELERSGKLGLVERMAIEYHHHVEAGEDRLGDLLATLERNGFGYQLEARLGPGAADDRGRFQNVLVYAYRKRDGA
jgi:FkbM family methyltransferase